MAQWVAHLTHNVEVVVSNPIKGPHCFLGQETLLYISSTLFTGFDFCLTFNEEVMGSNSIKGPHCFLGQETLPLLLSTG